MNAGQYLAIVDDNVRREGITADFCNGWRMTPEYFTAWSYASPTQPYRCTVTLHFESQEVDIVTRLEYE